jgi:agmatine deiminase
LRSLERNPTWSKEQIEVELCQALAVEKVLWIDGGSLEGDDTDSHIDQLVRFIRPGLVTVAVSRNSDDCNYEPLQKQLDVVRHVTDARGRSLDIVTIETPPPRYVQGQRVPESYCNFYIANDIVMVPQFGYRETDDAAMRILAELMPDRTMVPIDSRELSWGRGSFHCSTQQQPKTCVSV